jgi:hypothetical protein
MSHVRFAPLSEFAENGAAELLWARNGWETEKLTNFTISAITSEIDRYVGMINTSKPSSTGAIGYSAAKGIVSMVKFALDLGDGSSPFSNNDICHVAQPDTRLIYAEMLGRGMLLRLKHDTLFGDDFDALMRDLLDAVTVYADRDGAERVASTVLGRAHDFVDPAYCSMMAWLAILMNETFVLGSQLEDVDATAARAIWDGAKRDVLSLAAQTSTNNVLTHLRLGVRLSAMQTIIEQAIDTDLLASMSSPVQGGYEALDSVAVNGQPVLWIASNHFGSARADFDAPTPVSRASLRAGAR